MKSFQPVVRFRSGAGGTPWRRQDIAHRLLPLAGDQCCQGTHDAITVQVGFSFAICTTKRCLSSFDPWPSRGTTESGNTKPRMVSGLAAALLPRAPCALELKSPGVQWYPVVNDFDRKLDGHLLCAASLDCV
jgi:hypothetical protein